MGLNIILVSSELQILLHLIFVFSIFIYIFTGGQCLFVTLLATCSCFISRYSPARGRDDLLASVLSVQPLFSHE